MVRLAQILKSEIRQVTGRAYRIDYDKLDQESLQELLRMLRDIDYDKRAALNRARTQPWRRA
jgi:hypothetical protein